VKEKFRRLIQIAKRSEVAAATLNKMPQAFAAGTFQPK